MVSSGDGTLYLYKYHYPDQRRVKVRQAGSRGELAAVGWWALSAGLSCPAAVVAWVLS